MKDNARRMLEMNKNEDNPFLLFYRKVYLSLLVKCPEDFISIDVKKECTDNYLNSVKEGFYRES